MIITYTQAVIDYQTAGENLEKNHQAIKNGIAEFLKEAKSLIYSTSASADQNKLKELEQELKS